MSRRKPRPALDLAWLPAWLLRLVRRPRLAQPPQMIRSVLARRGRITISRGAPRHGHP